MAGEATVRKKFEVIRSAKRVRVRLEDFFSTDHQTNLFPAPRPGLMIFVYFPDVTEEEFKATLQYAKPGSIIELRSAPRFDIGGLNRRLAFHAFEDQNSVYIDLALSSDSSRRSEEHTSELQSHLNLVCRLLLEKKKKTK